MHGGCRPRREHLRPPSGHRRPPAARPDGQPPRHPGRGRQVRRHRRRARRPRGAAHARRRGESGPSARSSWSCWTNEEGARFTPPMVASGAFAGVFDVDWVLALRDDDGHAFGERARAHRLQRQGGGGRPGHRRLLRAAHRAGPDPRPRGGARRHRGGWLRDARHARRRPRRDRPRGADPDGPAEERAGGRRHARRRRQRHRLEAPRDGGQGHGGAHGGVAEQGGHPVRIRAAHLRRAPRRPGGGRSDARGGEGGHARLRAPRQCRDAHRERVAVRQRALRPRLHRADPRGRAGARRRRTRTS